MSWSRRASSARFWAALALAGIVVYVAIDVALVFLRPEFSVLHNAESDYGSKGHYAWLMDINFLLRAALSLAAVAAMAPAVRESSRLRISLTLLVVWAVLSGALAFFPDDPVGTRTHGSGAVHGVLAVIAFFAMLVGALAFSLRVRRLPSWRPVSGALLALSVLALIALLLQGHAHFGLHTLGGLYEKIFIALELAWLGTAAAFAARSEPTAQPATA